MERVDGGGEGEREEGEDGGGEVPIKREVKRMRMKMVSTIYSM